jgi:hypothetical protein
MVVINIVFFCPAIVVEPRRPPNSWKFCVVVIRRVIHKLSNQAWRWGHAIGWLRDLPGLVLLGGMISGNTFSYVGWRIVSHLVL